MVGAQLMALKVRPPAPRSSEQEEKLSSEAKARERNSLTWELKLPPPKEC